MKAGADELVATCTAKQAAVVATGSGCVAVVNKQCGTITYTESIDFSQGPSRMLKVDFRSPSGRACSPECQQVVDQLEFRTPIG